MMRFEHCHGGRAAQHSQVFAQNPGTIKAASPNKNSIFEIIQRALLPNSACDSAGKIH